MKRTIRVSMIVACAAASSIAALPVFADAYNGGSGPILADPPIVVGADWFATTDTPPAFFWPGGGMPLNSEGPFTFNSASPVRVDVTDDFARGDRFEVLDFGASLGLTSLVPVAGDGEQGPEAAFNNPAWSSGSFFLGPGAHSITLRTVVNPFDGGGRGYLRVLRVPEPNTIALACATLAGLMLAGSRNRR